MTNASFLQTVQKSNVYFPPEKDIFKTIWEEYERVIIESLVSSFGLDFIIKDQHGGDVDTIQNVRKVGKDPQMTYKNKKNQMAYENRPEYDASEYHGDARYKRINKYFSEKKNEGELHDAYTGKLLKRNEQYDLDHVIAAKEIHEDPGRILAGANGADLANSEENLVPTARSINRSKKQDDVSGYLKKWKEKKEIRQKEIQELSSKETLSDQEQKRLNKLLKLDEIQPDLMEEKNRRSRKIYERKLYVYYKSRKFLGEAACAAGKLGLQMGLRQVLGFVFTEVYFCTKERIRMLPPGRSLRDILQTIGEGIREGFLRAKGKYKELLSRMGEGLVSGIFSSLATTLTNIFFTTAKNVVRFGRQAFASVVQAGKVLLFNPENLPFGDRLKAVTVILATGASVLAGTAVGELLGKTAIAGIPVIGEVVVAFCSALTSGLLSCTLLLVLDRSDFINRVVSCLNKLLPSFEGFEEIAHVMELLAAKLEEIDIEKFHRDVQRYEQLSVRLMDCQDEVSMNQFLQEAYSQFDIKIPWKGNFNTFMDDKRNALEFT